MQRFKGPVRQTQSYPVMRFSNVTSSLSSHPFPPKHFRLCKNVTTLVYLLWATINMAMQHSALQQTEGKFGWLNEHLHQH